MRTSMYAVAFELYSAAKREWGYCGAAMRHHVVMPPTTATPSTAAMMTTVVVVVASFSCGGGVGVWGGVCCGALVVVWMGVCVIGIVLGGTTRRFSCVSDRRTLAPSSGSPAAPYIWLESIGCSGMSSDGLFGYICVVTAVMAAAQVSKASSRCRRGSMGAVCGGVCLKRETPVAFSFVLL